MDVKFVVSGRDLYRVFVGGTMVGVCHEENGGYVAIGTRLVRTKKQLVKFLIEREIKRANWKIAQAEDFIKSCREMLGDIKKNGIEEAKGE